MTAPHTPAELERRKARYFHDSRGKTDDPETEGYGWDDTRMFRDLEAAERLIRVVRAASNEGWLHNECTGGDCRLAQIRFALIQYLGAVPDFDIPSSSREG